MNNDEPTQRSALLDATFAASLAGEPALTLDVDAISRHGARRLRRRRSMAVSGVAASVVFLTAGMAIAVPRLNAGTSAAAPAGAQGCQTVLATNDPAYQSWKDAFLGGTSSVPAKATESGDAAGAAGDAGAPPTAGASATDPMHPAWYTPGKAAAMSEALLAALPAGTELRSAANDAKISEPQPFSLAAGPLASGMLQLGNDRGLLQLFVQPGNSNAGAPPCIESTALRYTAPDGTVATVTSGTAPDTGAYLVADAVHPDGTWVSAHLSLPPSANISSRLPVTAAQLARIIAAPGLSITG